MKFDSANPVAGLYLNSIDKKIMNSDKRLQYGN